MQALLDNIAALFFMGTFLISLLTLQSSVRTISAQIQSDIIEQQNLLTLEELFEYDFQKMGHNKAAPNLKPGTTDSIQVLFYGDLDNDGNADSVHYYLNPANSTLYRTHNTGSPTTVANQVADFRLTYLDSTLATVAYADLSTVNGVNTVRGIRLSITLQSRYAVENRYGGISWQTSFLPPGLQD